MKNILFISHDANRAGAQILLLRFLRLLKENPNFKFSILLKEGGIIEDEFKQIAPTYYWKQPNSEFKRSFLNKLYKKIRGEDHYNHEIIEILRQQKFDLIVANTITNGDILPIFSSWDIPIKTYVHELEMGIQQYTTPALFQNVIHSSDSFIACAASVKENLILNHSIDTTQVKVLPSILPETALTYQCNELINQQLRAKYNIPSDALLIGGMGTVDIRKGVDIFLQVASKLKSDKSIFFLWVGGQADETDFKNFQIDKTRLELQNIIFQTSVENPLDYMSIFDVFFVSSREDPYPLVVLEAAMLSKPIICFDKAGGAKDFVENDCGVIIEYLNVEEAVEQIIQLKENPLSLKQMGMAGRKKVLERHNKTIAFQTFVDILSEI